MNVMVQAHKLVKIALTKLAVKVPYRSLLSEALKQAHKEYKAMKQAKTKLSTKTVEGQMAIREQGKATFNAGESSNPYNEGTHAFELFLDGWIEASQNHYKNT